jgi:hypothetical protein
MNEACKRSSQLFAVPLDALIGLAVPDRLIRPCHGAGALKGVRHRWDRTPWSGLGPCCNGRAWAAAGTSGHQWSRGVPGRWPSRSCSCDDAGGRFGLWSRRAGVRVPSVTQDRSQPLFRHCRSQWPMTLTSAGLRWIRPDHDSAAPGRSGQALRGLCEEGPRPPKRAGEAGARFSCYWPNCSPSGGTSS